MNENEEQHLREHMDRAMTSKNGIAITCKDKADAERIRIHMYKIRSTERRMFNGKSPYDVLILRVQDDKLKLVNTGSILDYDTEEL